MRGEPPIFALGARPNTLESHLKIDPSLPVLIAGPTASGKSALAMQLAREHDGVIINADALQVYARWRALTARPSPDDTVQLPHALYGHVATETHYSVGHWLREVAPFLEGQPKRLPIIVGGTGLYFTTLTNGLADIPDVPQEVRQQANAIHQRDGLQALLDDLHTHDPDTFAQIDTQNPARVLRAWEVWRATGRGLSDWQDNTPPPILPLSQCNAFVLNAPKDWLTPRINLRFRQMLDQGALEECRMNLPDWDPKLPSSRAIGAAELIAHLRGEMRLEAAIEAAEITTRRYAKRQRSWFKARMGGWKWLDLSTKPL